MLQMIKTTAKYKDMQQFTEVQTKQLRLRHSSLKDRCGSPTSPTSTSFSMGKLRCQGRGKSPIFDYSTIARSDREIRNLKLTRQLNWTPGNFLFLFSWRRMMSAGTSNLTGLSNNGYIIKLPLFHHCRYADTVLSGRFTRWRPHSTQSIPIFGRIFSDTTPIKCVFEARLRIWKDLTRPLALHFWPRGSHGAAGDAIRNNSSLR